MRETFLHLIDVESISEDQALQISLPLKYGGCGLRTHTISELRRLFVSSAMLIAPAVRAATGFSVGEAQVLDDLAAEISPFDVFFFFVYDDNPEKHMKRIREKKKGICQTHDPLGV